VLAPLQGKKELAKEGRAAGFLIYGRFCCKAPKKWQFTGVVSEKWNKPPFPFIANVHVSFFLHLFLFFLSNKCYLYALRMKSWFFLANTRRALPEGLRPFFENNELQPALPVLRGMKCGSSWHHCSKQSLMTLDLCS